ncbi:MAG: hypothetical protein NZ602_02870 [Thermoguttaceae bacterium]|nr:hypothetical protein [Thermoguttaceae bacterium]MDW8039114.1 hypothetical protein [Thermoguttaceae bacterium]
MAWFSRLYWFISLLGWTKGKKFSSRWVVGCTLGLFVGVGSSVWGAEGPLISRLKRPSPESPASREAQDAALQAIPWERLDKTARAKVEEVVSGASLFRRMPVELIQCDPEFFLFCVHHPEVVVHIWQVLGLSRMKVQPTAQGTYYVDDGMGTCCEAQFLYQSPQLHLIYAQGSYEGPVLKRKVYGRAVLVLHSPVRRQEQGQSWIACQLDTFLQMEPGAVEVLTKTLHPLIGRVSEYNFKQTARFVEELWLCGQKNPGQLERLTSRLQALPPELRQEFLRLSQQSGRPAKASTSAPSQPPPSTTPSVSETSMP